MTKFGYTMMTEQSPPDQLVIDLRAAEAAGFDFSVISDHYQPWLSEQGHSGYAWSILGAAAQATERIGLMTFVTCPIMRYHPAVVAQKAATIQILSGNRFRLGLGAGENLNEHVVGERWPAVGVRHEMLSEAVDIIARLLHGNGNGNGDGEGGGDGGHGRGGGNDRHDDDDGDGRVNYRGRHFSVEQAKLWDRPRERVPIGVAVSGQGSCRLAGRKADLMVGVEPKPELVEMFDAAGGTGKPRVGQVPLAYDTDRDAAIARAHEQFRWFGLGWKVNADLPNPESFDSATQFVTRDDVAGALGCGADVDEHVEKIKPFIEAGYDEIALVQIGADQQEPFIAWAERELLPALRSL